MRRPDPRLPCLGALLLLAACDPTVDRANPHDPATPAADREPATVRVEVIHPEAGPAQRFADLSIALEPVQVAVPSAIATPVPDAARSDDCVAPGGLALRVPDGRWRLVVEATGYRSVLRELDVGPGECRDLGPLTLVDIADPLAPRLLLAPGTPSRVRRRAQVLCAGHDEPGVVFEAARGRTDGPCPEDDPDCGVYPAESACGDDIDRYGPVDVDACPPEAPRAIPICLEARDGRHRLSLVARDPAGRASLAASVDLELDTTAPPDVFALRLDEVTPPPGAPMIVSRPNVVAQVLPAAGLDVSGFTFGVGDVTVDAPEADCGARCAGSEGAPACATPVGRETLISLASDRRWHCVCWSVCDAAGNPGAVSAAAVHLAPHAASRPRPILAPDQLTSLVARRSDAPTMTVRGEGIDLGAALLFGDGESPPRAPCVIAEPSPAHCTDADPSGCATACVAEVPEAVRLRAGRYPVRLEQPGVGEAEGAAALWVASPTPCIDQMAPMGVTEPDGALTITLRGRDVADMQATLAGVEGAVVVGPDPRAPGDADAVEVTVTFDGSALPRSPAPDALRLTDATDDDPALAAQRAADLRSCHPTPGPPPALPFTVAPAAAAPRSWQEGLWLGRSASPAAPGRVGLGLGVPRVSPRIPLVGPARVIVRGAGPTGAPVEHVGGGGQVTVRLPYPIPEAVAAVEGPAIPGARVALREPPAMDGRPLCAARRRPIGELRLLSVGHLPAPAAREPIWHRTQPVLAFAEGSPPERLSLCAPVDRAANDPGGCVTLSESPPEGGWGWGDAVTAAGDFTGEGQPDLAVAWRDAAGHALALYAVDDGGGLARAGALTLPSPEDCPGAPAALRFADLDGDRLPELYAGYSENGGCVALWTMAVDGRWAGPAVVPRGGRSPRLISAPTGAGPTAALLIPRGDGAVHRIRHRPGGTRLDRALRAGAAIPLDIDAPVRDAPGGDVEWAQFGALDAVGGGTLWLGHRAGVSAWRAHGDTWQTVEPADRDWPPLTFGGGLLDLAGDGRLALLGVTDDDPPAVVGIDVETGAVTALGPLDPDARVEALLPGGDGGALALRAIDRSGEVIDLSPAHCDAAACPPPADITGPGVHLACVDAEAAVVDPGCGDSGPAATLHVVLPETMALDIAQPEGGELTLVHTPPEGGSRCHRLPGGPYTLVAEAGERHRLDFVRAADVEETRFTVSVDRRPCHRDIPPPDLVAEGANHPSVARPDGRIELRTPCGWPHDPSAQRWIDVDGDERADLVALADGRLLFGMARPDRGMDFCAIDLDPALVRTLDARRSPMPEDVPWARLLAIPGAPDDPRPWLCSARGRHVACGRAPPDPCAVAPPDRLSFDYVARAAGGDGLGTRALHVARIAGEAHPVAVMGDTVRVLPPLSAPPDPSALDVYNQRTPEIEDGVRPPLRAAHVADLRPDDPALPGGASDEILLDAGEQILLSQYTGTSRNGEPGAPVQGRAWDRTRWTAETFDPDFFDDATWTRRRFARLREGTRPLDRLALYVPRGGAPTVELRPGRADGRVNVDGPSRAVLSDRLVSVAFAVTDVDADGRADLLVGGMEFWPDRPVIVEAHVARGELDLERALDARSTGPAQGWADDAALQPEAMHIAGADVTGEGLLDVVTTIAPLADDPEAPARVHVRPLAAPGSARLRVTAPVVDGLTSFALPAGWYTGAEVVVRDPTDARRGAVDVTLAPPSAAAEVEPAPAASVAAGLWHFPDADPPERQPAGDWRVGVDAADGATVELIVDVSWIHPAP